MAEFNWSDDRIATLKSLWLDGLSASRIARQLGGLTRNAVIGKIHRLGLNGRQQLSTPVRCERPKAPQTNRRSQMAVAPPLVRRAPPPMSPQLSPEGPGLVSSMTLLGPGDCKWPIGDPKADDFSFCGRKAIGPYCEAHTAQAFEAGTAWRGDRDPAVRRLLGSHSA